MKRRFPNSNSFRQCVRGSFAAAARRCAVPAWEHKFHLMKAWALDPNGIIHSFVFVDTFSDTSERESVVTAILDTDDWYIEQLD
jgi:hypothetical protein